MRRRSSDRSIRSRLARAAYLLACAIALASIGSACGSERGAREPRARGHPGRARAGAAAAPAPPTAVPEAPTPGPDATGRPTA